MYYLRLDDASPFWDKQKWQRMSELLERYSIKPIIGIIPDNKDPSMLSSYELDKNFWQIAKKWEESGWATALHGFNHVYVTTSGGVNPVHRRSEFAGLPYSDQLKMIHQGYSILLGHNLNPLYFFAPSHTFDEATIKAVLNGSNIRCFSDTIANDVYYAQGIYFLPQQAGQVRKLPFKTTTFCYHPNTMSDKAFENLENFLKKNKRKFGDPTKIQMKKRKFSFFDKILQFLYFRKNRK
jgi:predicted deacetylase